MNSENSEQSKPVPLDCTLGVAPAQTVTVITDKAHQHIVECFDLAYDTEMVICKPLLLAGDGSFYAMNGNHINAAEVLKQHHSLQTAIGIIKAKLDIAKSEITRINSP